MRPFNRTSLAIAALSALGSAVSAHFYFERLEAEVSGGPRISVLVAAADIPVGAPLTRDSLAVRDVPRAYVEGRQVRASEVKQVIGARVIGGLKASEALLWTDVSKASERARVLSGLVDNGRRAVMVDGRRASFDGLLRPGDRVDVLMTTDDHDGTTTTLLQNLLVLAVGNDVNPSGDGASVRASSDDAITLSTTVEQAQRLTLATARGHLTLTVRNPDDIQLVEKIPQTTGRDLDPSRSADFEPASPHKEHLERVR